MEKLDINKIIEDNDWKTDSNGSSLDYTYGNMQNAIKQGIKEALPEILDYVDKEVDKDFYTDIPNLEKEILKKTRNMTELEIEEKIFNFIREKNTKKFSNG